VAPAHDSVEAKSTLAEENRLFQRAADASRDGDIPGALAELERLLQEHPTSPLAQTALVRKFRLLAKAGRSTEAKQEAERYLASYPMGFAVREAESLAGATAAPTPSALAEPASPPGR
jgi:outer membrane protein assembly factor BamD (BamD/ComL family)